MPTTHIYRILVTISYKNISDSLKSFPNIPNILLFTMEEENSTPVESSTESDGEVETGSPQKKTVTPHKPGIVYLSTVPTGFNVSQTTTFFTEFGRLVG